MKVQNGLAKTCEIPTGSDIAELVWTQSSRLITGGAPTAASVASAVWSATERTLTATPEYNGPTTSEIAEAVCGTDLTTLTDLQPGSLYTVLQLQANSQMDLSTGTLTVYNADGTVHTAYVAVIGTDGRILGFRLSS